MPHVLQCQAVIQIISETLTVAHLAMEALEQLVDWLTTPCVEKMLFVMNLQELVVILAMQQLVIDVVSQEISIAVRSLLYARRGLILFLGVGALVMV